MAVKYGFFLGCIAPLRYPGIEKATRVIFKEMGFELVDLDGAGCCPAPGVVRSFEEATRVIFKEMGFELVDLDGAGCCPAPGVVRSFDEATWLALGARNLAIAEKQGVDIMTICNGCYGSLFDVAHILHEDHEKLKKVNEILKDVGLHYSGKTNVRHFAEVMYNDVGIEKLKSHVKNPLVMDVAAHYGCHFARPSKIKHIDDPERPHILDELIEWTGAKSLNYKDKMMCCGSGGGVRSRNATLATEFTAEKLKNIKAAGGKFIVDVCPFCHLQFDRTQHDTVKGYDIPVIHLAQLYGLAFGMPKSELGLEAHAIKVNL